MLDAQPYGGGYQAYGYGYDYAYGYGDAYDCGGAYDPLYGYSTSTTDPATGYIHQHSIYGYASGSFYQVTDETRGPGLDHVYQYTRSYASGVYETDVVDTSTPLDGVYGSYGTRRTTSYDTVGHERSTDSVTFSAGYSQSYFTSTDDDTGGAVTSYDARSFGAYGFYDYTRSSYAGPGGDTSSATSAYRYS